MPIQIQNDLLDLNPGYNDSIITYTSNSLTGLTKSEIIIGSSTFTVYPINEIFTYNFMDIVKVKINQNNFNDSIVPLFESSCIYDDPTLSLTILPTINV